MSDINRDEEHGVNDQRHQRSDFVELHEGRGNDDRSGYAQQCDKED